MFFPKQELIELTSDDFKLSDDNKLKIKDERKSFVIFLTDNVHSRQTKDIWLYLSTKIAGVNFFFVDLTKNEDVKQVITEYNNDLKSPYRHFTCSNFPLMLYYKNGEPFEKYIGVVSQYDLRNWCLTSITDKKENDEEEQGDQVI